MSIIINPALLLPQVTEERNAAREFATSVEAALCLVIIAAGGEVRVPKSLLAEANEVVWRKWTDEEHDCIVFEAKHKNELRPEGEDDDH